MAEIRPKDREHLDSVWEALRKTTKDAPGKVVDAFEVFAAIGGHIEAKGLPRPSAGTIRHLVEAAGYPYHVRRDSQRRKQDQRFEGLALR